jgi:hypothetical protein
MTESTGPVQILAVAFGRGASFEGRIAEEIDKLEGTDTIRVIDLVFLHRDEVTGELLALDYDDSGGGDGRLTLLDGADDGQLVAPAGAMRLGADDIRQAADELEPGTSMCFMLFEHLWARDLKRAIADNDGELFAEGFLGPDAVKALAHP